MRFVDPPQRLHRDVEGAVAERAELLALVDHCDEFRRWPGQYAVTVEARDFAVIAIERKDPLIPLDLMPHLQDRAARQRLVPVPERQLRRGAEHLALPAEEPSARHGRTNARSEQRQAGCGGDDAEGAAAGEVTHSPPPGR